MAKILIIDRDIMEALMEESALELEGHEVRIEPGGARGLAAISEGWPDLVILDPNHEVGVQAVHEARAATAGASPVPLLLVSNPHEGPSLGSDELADDHLEHPFDVAALQGKVDQLLASLR